MPVVEKVGLEDAVERVRQALGGSADVAANFDAVEVTCEPAKLGYVLHELRDRDDLRFRFFTFLSGVDRSTFGGEEADEGSKPEHDLEVLIHLYSPDYAMHVTIHVPVDTDDPRCPSSTDVFRGAIWQERETHEMFGIHFDGHPHLVNLYLPEDFEGNPLRKTFKLPGRVVKAWPGAKDPEEAAAARG